MNNRTKLGLNILEAALLLGVLGDALLRQTPWGVNVFLWAGALVAAMWALRRARPGVGASWRADGGWLLLPVGFFAAAFAWRDSATLKLLDGLALFVAFALLAWRARGRQIRLGGLADYALGLGHAAFDAMFASLPLVIKDVRWASLPRDGVMRHAWAAARGLVIAVPLLFIFGALFMAADAVFEGIMRQTFQLDAGLLFSHFFLMLLFAWMTGGFLRGMMLAEEMPGTVQAGAVSEAVPVAYTSITVDDKERHGATATGTTREGEPDGHRRPPESVVVEGGATAADGKSVGAGDEPGGGGVEKPHDSDVEKPHDSDVERPRGSDAEKSGGSDAEKSGSSDVEKSNGESGKPGSIGDAGTRASGTSNQVSDASKQALGVSEQASGAINQASGASNGASSASNQVSGAGERGRGAGERGGEAGEQARDVGGVAVQAAAQGFSLGAVEVCVVLGLLNVLFACFVVVQFRYFFGGAAHVMSITELTYSEYARRGFFELTWVAGLVLPLLLGAHALLRKDSPAAGRIFRMLAGAQVALLFVIMVSAVARMRLYQSEYGLTELRLYTTAFMAWLGLVFIWFAWTVLVRDARRRFACGALVAAFITNGLLHLVNPDAYIVRANAAHARAGRSFDAGYAASLSADAVPALISALPTLSRDERCLAARELLSRWAGRPPGEDWRAWSLARSRAWRTVAAHQESLSEATCPPPAAGMPLDTSTTAPPAPPPAPLTNTIHAGATSNADAATIPLTAETKSAAGTTKASKAAPRDKGKAKQRKRTRAARMRKTR